METFCVDPSYDIEEIREFLRDPWIWERFSYGDIDYSSEEVVPTEHTEYYGLLVDDKLVGVLKLENIADGVCYLHYYADKSVRPFVITFCELTLRYVEWYKDKCHTFITSYPDCFQPVGELARVLGFEDFFVERNEYLKFGEKHNVTYMRKKLNGR